MLFCKLNGFQIDCWYCNNNDIFDDVSDKLASFYQLYVFLHV
jgi:hypothetical protein